MGLFVRTCTAMQLEGFVPQQLANIINGEGTQMKRLVCAHRVRGMLGSLQGSRSWGIRQARSSWGCSYGHARRCS
jgi:hypothetical protein